MSEEEMRAWIAEDAIKSRGLAFIIEKKLAAPLNVIFDIDHTLIFAFDRQQNT